jgi:membrane glycosyltransferase
MPEALFLLTLYLKSWFSYYFQVLKKHDKDARTFTELTLTKCRQQRFCCKDFMAVPIYWTQEISVLSRFCFLIGFYNKLFTYLGIFCLLSFLHVSHFMLLIQMKEYLLDARSKIALSEWVGAAVALLFQSVRHCFRCFAYGVGSS